MTKNKTTQGMRTFLIIWFGQVISLFGSGLFGFAVGVWVYLKTQSVTLLALVMVFDAVPGVLIAPFAGAVVDRSDRRWAMIQGDSGSALSTLAIALLIWSGMSPNWLFYLALAVGSISNAFQWPAYEASIALLAPKEMLSRVNGLRQLGEAIATVFAPLLAGVLVSVIEIHGVIMIDFVTFLFAVATLFIVRIPRPPSSPALDEKGEEEGSFLRESIYGWKYIKARHGLLSLLLFFTMLNFFVNVIFVLDVPLVLSFASKRVLGIVLSIGGAGMLLGGLLMSKWGGPKRHVYGVLGFAVFIGVFLALYGLRCSIPLVCIASFGFFFCLPIINVSSQSIWQKKVALEAQGRVFSIRRMLAQISQPVGAILAGPLADKIFEPMLVDGGALSNSVGQIIGTGPGRGIGLMFIIMGLFVVVSTGLGYLYPRLRLLEDKLPDMIPDTIVT